MSDSELDRLRAVAEAATPGVWKLWGMTVMADQDGTGNVDTAVGVAATFYRDENDKPRTWDAAHIAAFDPPTVLALLDRLASAEAAMARVTILHDRWARLAGEAMDSECREWLAASSASLRAALDQPAPTTPGGDRMTYIAAWPGGGDRPAGKEAFGSEAEAEARAARALREQGRLGVAVVYESEGEA